MDWLRLRRSVPSRLFFHHIRSLLPRHVDQEAAVFAAVACEYRQSSPVIYDFERQNHFVEAGKPGRLYSGIGPCGAMRVKPFISAIFRAGNSIRMPMASIGHIRRGREINPDTAQKFNALPGPDIGGLEEIGLSRAWGTRAVSINCLVITGSRCNKSICQINSIIQVKL